MEFRVLGPFEVVDGDRLVALPRRRQRALLAILVLHAGEPLTADRLIEDIWGESSPPAARAALQNNVAQLRAALGVERIVLRPGGYVLDTSDDDIDLVRFRRLAERARASTDNRSRCTAAREALALWRGPPLQDLVYEPFAAVEVPRLEEERFALYVDLIEAELALGRHAEVLAELAALVDEHPYDERLRCQLIVALYRSGRQVDALAACRRARLTLVEEFGLEPGGKLRSLEAKILNQDPELDPPAVPPPAVEPIRRTVTVLCAALPHGGDATEPETMHAKQVRFLDSVRSAVEYHGGTIEQAAGDTALAIFGLPAAHEDDALRALRAAVTAEQAQAFGGRYGVATGDVYAERSSGGELHVAGGALITARQLERTARPGKILISAATLRLVRDAVKVEPRSATTRVPASFRLVEIIEGAAPFGRRLDTPLINRRRELAELEDAFAEVARERRSRLVTVLGEAGIGKTRLARELITHLSDSATVLAGRCVSYGEGATYKPLAEMLSELGDDIEQALDGATSTGEELVALRRYFEALARKRPLVLVFEDIHWAAPTLLNVIDQLGKIVDAAVFVLCLSRPGVREQRPDWQVAMRLERLDDDETLALVRALGGSAEPGTDERIVEIAEGNALYAEQLLAFTAEDGALDALPPTLDALLLGRLDQLGREERQVLQRAAIVGREFTRGALAHLCAPDVAATLDERLGALERSGLAVAVPGFGFRFHHILIRDAAYASLPKTERADLHERIADWLDDAPDELVGHHLERAVHYRLELDPTDKRAVRLAADAGRQLGAAGLRAWKRGDAPAAVSLLGRAVELLPEHDPFRLELMCELGVASRGAGDLQRAEGVLATAAVTAQAAGDRRCELRARLELTNVRLFSDPGGRADELLEVAHDAAPVFEAVGDDHALARAWRLIAYVWGSMRCRYERSVEAADRALASERKSGWSTAAILGDLSAALFYGPTPVPEAIRRCTELLEHADLGGEANVLPFLAGLEAMRKCFPRARVLLERAEQLYADLGQHTFGLAACASQRAEVELLAGDLAAAEEALHRSRAALETMRDRARLATCAAELAAVTFRIGRFEDADGWSRVGEELGSEDDIPTQFLSRAVRAKLLAREGHAANAEAFAREAVTLSETTDSLSQRANVLLDLADVLRLCGRPAPAAEAGRHALELFEQKRNIAGAGQARALLAELAPV